MLDKLRSEPVVAAAVAVVAVVYLIGKLAGLDDATLLKIEAALGPLVALIARARVTPVPERTDNSARPEDGDQDITQDPEPYTG